MNVTDQQRVRMLKVARLKAGGVPRTLEICSGSGGLSLGLSTAGFELSAHIEIDAEAAATYALNFGSGRDVADPWLSPRDMEECAADDLVRDLNFQTPTSLSFDVLAAGLPCQAFARIGRSKLREVTGQHDAFRKDPRAGLYRRFLEYVGATQPLIVLVENVPDILNFGGHNLPEDICDWLTSAGYRCSYTILNASYYGVPQVRERLFLVAFADVLHADPVFPDPTHFVQLPRGYEGSRRVALKHVDRRTSRFVEIKEPAPSLALGVGTREALGDLPTIVEHRTDARSLRRRRLTTVIPYRREAETGYEALMRAWPGFETTRGTDGHLVRITPRDFPIFQAMTHGADYPEARRIAQGMFNEALGYIGLTHDNRESEIYRELRASIVPPYDPAKFPNKWWKLDPAKPSRTLTAHMGKDTYSHVHYDSVQARTVSVREAARLQSFPDGFHFAGAMNAAFRQIGNAVPPLLGLAVATSLKAQLSTAIQSLQVTSSFQVA